MGAKAATIRIQVLLGQAEGERFAAYCRERGFKKSTLIARLVQEHLDREEFPEQQQALFPALPRRRKPEA